MDAVVSKVIELVAEQCGEIIANISVDTHLADALGFDNLDYIELCFAIEDEYGIHILDGEMEDGQTNTVQDVINLVVSKLPATV